MADIEDFDPRSAAPADREAWCAVAARVEEEHPALHPPRPPRSYLAELLHPRALSVDRRWVARDLNGAVVGWCEASWRDTPDNPDLVFVDVAVLPEHRRAGVGTALLRAMTPYARSHARTIVTAGARADSAASEFLAHRGAEQKTVDRRSLLDLRQLDVDALLRWGRPAPSAEGRYSLVQWRESTPEDLLADHAALRTAMNDAPRESLQMEDEHITGDIVRAFETAGTARGDEAWVTCARHDPSGRLVGLTDINGPAYWPELAFQEDTVVLREHRGHGLGRWIKAANLALVIAERPSTEWVQTFNAGVNQHMLDINEAMGFRVADWWGEWQIPLDRLESSLR